MRRVSRLLPLLVLAAGGCDWYHYHAGHFFEDTGRYPSAIDAYETYARLRPGDPKAAETLVRAARIYSGHFRRCLEARRLYEDALRRFPSAEPWATEARAGLLSCPDYFPLDTSRAWVYGDTASQGRNMRLEWEMRVSSGPGRGEIVAALFAGNKRVSARSVFFEKRDWSVWEVDGGHRTPILKYPFVSGTAWSGKRGFGKVEFLIESDAARAVTAAGTFTDCLKVREVDVRFPGSWKYEYYAPGVGRVKTTVGGKGYENPNTELLKYGLTAEDGLKMVK